MAALDVIAEDTMSIGSQKCVDLYWVPNVCVKGFKNLFDGMKNPDLAFKRLLLPSEADRVFHYNFGLRGVNDGQTGHLEESFYAIFGCRNANYRRYLLNTLGFEIDQEVDILNAPYAFSTNIDGIIAHYQRDQDIRGNTLAIMKQRRIRFHLKLVATYEGGKFKGVAIPVEEIVLNIP